jgi:transposase
MAEMHKIFAGVDISKSSFDVVLYIESVKYQLRFGNDQSGFRQFQKWLKKRKVSEIHACMEATGRYADELARFLYDRGYEVSVVNPKQIKAHGESMLIRNKTDAGDAAIIEDFCRKHRPQLWEPPAPEIEELKMMTRHLEALKDMRTQELNRLKSGITALVVQEMIQEHIVFLNQEIEQLEAKIDEHINHHPGLKKDAELIESIPGIGSLTAAILMAEIKDINAFGSACELACYAGLSPQHRRSGSSLRGRTKLSKIGNATLRKALFFPSMSARRHNPIVKAFCERLSARGKQTMVIQGAAMRKLLHIVYGVWKTGRPFDPTYEMRLAVEV